MEKLSKEGELFSRLIDAIQGAREYPLSHAVYDIAKAIENAPDSYNLSEAVEKAGNLIRDGLLEVAEAIREHK